MIFLGHQVIDQNANVRLGTVQDQHFLSKYLLRRIDSCHQTLSGRFLISGTSVELTAGKQPMDRLEFQRRIELLRIDTVVFDRIGIADDFCMFQSRHRMIHFFLYILRQRT